MRWGLLSAAFTSKLLLLLIAVKADKLPPGGVSTFGKLFYATFPESLAKTEIHCLLYTKEFTIFNVKRSTLGHGSNETTTYPLTNEKPTTVVFYKPRLRFFHPRTHSFTDILQGQYPFQVTCYSVNALGIPHAAMTVVPVEGLGKVYLVPIIPYLTSFHVFNGDVELILTIKETYITPDGSEKNYVSIRDPNLEKYFLKSFETLSVQYCNNIDRDKLKAFTIKGKHAFGVVTGTCLKESDHPNATMCQPDSALDMLLPLTEYFTFFIVAIPRNFSANISVSFTGITEIFVNNDRIGVSHKQEASRNLGEYKGLHVIILSKPAYLAVELYGQCPFDKSRIWRVMTFSVLPRSVYIDSYIWATAFHKSHEQYILVVYKVPHQFNILLDGFSIYRILGPARYNETVQQRFYFASVELDCTPGRHQLYSINAQKFGAYLYGFEKYTQSKLFMTPLGFVSQPGVQLAEWNHTHLTCVADYNKKVYSNTEGDLIDNDCDSVVDEELMDGKDNDNDGSIDEDLAAPFIRNGEWSTWEPWQCENANEKMKNRERFCNNPPPINGGFFCYGNASDSRLANCTHLIDGIADGQMIILAVNCLCEEKSILMASITRECEPPDKGGVPCLGETQLIYPHDSCLKGCYRKEICSFERAYNIETRLDRSYARAYNNTSIGDCTFLCTNVPDCQGFVLWLNNPDKPFCWLYHRLSSGKELPLYNTYIQRCNMVCEAGYQAIVSNLRDQATCTKCPLGTYKSLTSANPCKSCPAHKSTASGGSTGSEDCIVVSCDPGFYLIDETTCKPCKLNTYKQVKGNQGCLPCPTDKFTTTVGSTHINNCTIKPCEPGYYSNDNIKCIVCRIGTYKSERGTQDCTLCPVSRTTAVNGSTHVDNCSVVLVTTALKTTTTSPTPSTTMTTMTPFSTPTAQPKLTIVLTTFIPLTLKKKYPGKWGGWSEWSCLKNCTVKSVVRTRPCLDPPEGPRDFECPGFAYQLGKDSGCNLICATTCPHGFWGFNCSKTCPQCVSDCDKETGICTKCVPGFRHPIMHCTDACGEMTYGAGCTGDCAKKCAGQDCIERVEGACPSQSIWRSNWWFVALVLLIIPIIILARLSGRKAREQYEIAEANELFGGEDNADNVEVTQSEISEPKSYVSQQREISRIFESKTSLSTSV